MAHQVTTNMTNTVAFFGASTGVGLAALKKSLAAGIDCIALCRNPSKLRAIFPAESTPNLQVVQGNAHDVSAVSGSLLNGAGKLVDGIVSTIGGKFDKSSMSIDDPEVCRKGMSTLLEALTQLRRKGIAGKPHIVICSTTGISRFGRDIPLAMIPLYLAVMKVPHADKKIMEDMLIASEEDYTVVRASLFIDGKTGKKVRVGIEDPKNGRESKAIGYTISREDTGRWIAENLVLKRDVKFLRKIATVTY